MKRLTLLIAFSLLFEFVWCQNEKLTLKEKGDVFSYFSNLEKSEMEFIDNTLDSLHSEILDFAEIESFLDNEVIQLMSNSNFEPSIDTLSIHYLKIEFQRGGIFYYQRGEDFKDKTKRRTMFHMMEYHKEINERNEIPVNLIKKYTVDFDRSFSDYKFNFVYDLKVKGINKFEMLSKNVTRIR